MVHLSDYRNKTHDISGNKSAPSATEWNEMKVAIQIWFKMDTTEEKGASKVKNNLEEDNRSRRKPTKGLYNNYLERGKEGLGKWRNMHQN